MKTWNKGCGGKPGGQTTRNPRTALRTEKLGPQLAKKGRLCPEIGAGAKKLTRGGQHPVL
ncbi:MAG: hypothetical protein QM296_02270 [Bacillota bacterium]|nr:hypothetical protein [Bacillota bacterium]